MASLMGAAQKSTEMAEEKANRQAEEIYGREKIDL